LKIAFGCPILEGYGQTESCGASHITLKDDGNAAGLVGGICRNLESKVVDVPDMGYTCKDKDANGNPLPRGEVCMRGPQLFKRYFKNEEKTREALDEDGWLHTGDIGQVHMNGAFQIIDRKKNIFKLSIGEYIAPEKIENVYKRSKYVADVFIYGSTLESYLLGVFVPDKTNLMQLAESLGVKGTFEELCENKVVTAKYLEEINKKAKEEKLWSFEMVKKIKLECRPFSSLDLCTPSFKLKRAEATKLYKDMLHGLYAEGLDDKKGM